MFTMEIKTGGEAFRDPMTGEEDNYYEEREISRILGDINRKITFGERSGSVMDLNGNKVGKWEIR